MCLPIFVLTTLLMHWLAICIASTVPDRAKDGLMVRENIMEIIGHSF